MVVKPKDAGQGESRRYDPRRLRSFCRVGRRVRTVVRSCRHYGRTRAGLAPASAAAAASSAAAAAAGAASSAGAAAASAAATTATAAAAASTAAPASFATAASSAAATAALARSAAASTAFTGSAAASTAAAAFTGSAAASTAAAAIAGTCAAAASSAAGLAASGARTAAGPWRQPAARADTGDDNADSAHRHDLPRSRNANGLDLLAVAVERFEWRVVGSGRIYRPQWFFDNVRCLTKRAVCGTADLPAGR
jgi:hypothetical protein